MNKQENKILILDSTVVDIYENGKTVVGGCGCNVASVLKNRGKAYDFFTPIGDDKYADMIEEELKEYNNIPCKIEGETSGHCKIIIGENKERTFDVCDGVEVKYKKEWLDNIDISKYNYVYIPGFALKDQESAKAIVEWFEEHRNIQIIFAPGPSIEDNKIDEKILKRIFSLKPIVHINDEEVINYIANCKDDGVIYENYDVEESTKKLWKKTGNIVVVTMGSKGAGIYDENGFRVIPGEKIEKEKVVDTSGAGDNHCGGFISGLFEGMSTEEAVKLGNKIASDVIQIYGPKLGKKTDVNEIVEGEGHERNK